jgi:hypothetical protein
MEIGNFGLLIASSHKIVPKGMPRMSRQAQWLPHSQQCGVGHELSEDKC